MPTNIQGLYPTLQETDLGLYIGQTHINILVRRCSQYNQYWWCIGANKASWPRNTPGECEAPGECEPELLAASPTPPSPRLVRRPRRSAAGDKKYAFWVHLSSNRLMQVPHELGTFMNQPSFFPENKENVVSKYESSVDVKNVGDFANSSVELLAGCWWIGGEKERAMHCVIGFSRQRSLVPFLLAALCTISGWWP